MCTATIKCKLHTSNETTTGYCIRFMVAVQAIHHDLLSVFFVWCVYSQFIVLKASTIKSESLLYNHYATEEDYTVWWLKLFGNYLTSLVSVLSKKYGTFLPDLKMERVLTTDIICVLYSGPFPGGVRRVRTTPPPQQEKVRFYTRSS